MTYERTVAFVDSLNDSRVLPREIDVGDVSALQGLVEEADLVMNTTGPHYRFGV